MSDDKIKVSLVLPPLPGLIPGILEVAETVKDQIGLHRNHTSCPWTSGECILFGFGLVLSQCLSDAILMQDWDEEEIDLFLASVKTNAYSYLKSNSSG